VFPEGTRINAKTQKSSKAFMEKQGYPELQHLICPRFKGTQDILQEVRGLQLSHAERHRDRETEDRRRDWCCYLLLTGTLLCARARARVFVRMCFYQGRETFKAVYDVTIGYKPIAKYLFW
jgi:hypothetical protein